MGFEESIKVVEKAFEEHGPFDGLLGFSQGACFVALLCDLQQRNCKYIKCFLLNLFYLLHYTLISIVLNIFSINLCKISLRSIGTFQRI